MIHIAIVEDDVTARDTLHQYLKNSLSKRSLEFDITEFINGESFMEKWDPHTYHIVFFDIYMDVLTGIEVAKLVRQKDKLVKIIFLTTSDEFVFDSFSVKATYYLLKPFVPEKLEEAISYCFPESDDRNNLFVSTQNGSSIIDKDEIIYIEHIARSNYIHTVREVIESKESFQELQKQFEEDSHFLICSRGILLNMRYIKEQEDSVFVMTDASRIPISRRLRKNVMARFQEFALSDMGKGGSL